LIHQWKPNILLLPRLLCTIKKGYYTDIGIPNGQRNPIDPNISAKLPLLLLLLACGAYALRPLFMKSKLTSACLGPSNIKLIATRTA
jgi:hypothetical protein